MKGGYEVGVHAMRELISQAKIMGEVIILLDFANEFNTVDRNLMLRLTAAYALNVRIWFSGCMNVSPTSSQQVAIQSSLPLERNKDARYQILSLH